MSFYPYELINIQSCLVWLERLPLVLSEGSHTGHFLRRCAVCAILLTINLLCVYHIPLFSILSSTVGCGGDNSLHALSAPTALSARSRETGVSDHLMLQADTKMKVLTDCRLVYVTRRSSTCVGLIFTLLKKDAQRLERRLLCSFQSKSMFSLRSGKLTNVPLNPFKNVVCLLLLYFTVQNDVWTELNAKSVLTFLC